MFKFLDRWIEKKLKARLHAKTEKFIETFKQQTIAAHPEWSAEDQLDACSKIDTEGVRVLHIVDRSILKAMILRARWGFWISLVVTLPLVGVVIILTHGTAIPLILPVAGVIVGWSIYIATIPPNYMQRVKGGLESAVALYQKTREERVSADIIQCEMEAPMNSAQIMSLIENNPGRKIDIHIWPSGQASDGEEKEFLDDSGCLKVHPLDSPERVKIELISFSAPTLA